MMINQSREHLNSLIDKYVPNQGRPKTKIGNLLRLIDDILLPNLYPSPFAVYFGQTDVLDGLYDYTGMDLDEITDRDIMDYIEADIEGAYRNGVSYLLNLDFIYLISNILIANGKKNLDFDDVYDYCESNGASLFYNDHDSEFINNLIEDFLNIDIDSNKSWLESNNREISDDPRTWKSDDYPDLNGSIRDLLDFYKVVVEEEKEDLNYKDER